MKQIRALRVSFLVALATVLAVEPAASQGKGKTRGDDQAPPGWCRGRGNPHNPRENCGPGSSRNNGRVNRDRGNASSEDAHRAFHRVHDRVCRERASQRPFDLRWQLQVRSECRAAHDRWHEVHDPQRRY